MGLEGWIILPAETDALREEQLPEGGGEGGTGEGGGDEQDADEHRGAGAVEPGRDGDGRGGHEGLRDGEAADEGELEGCGARVGVVREVVGEEDAEGLRRGEIRERRGLAHGLKLTLLMPQVWALIIKTQPTQTQP